jgi:replication factor A1
MGDGNYERIVKKISSLSGLDIDEIERRVEGKRAKLAGLISREGAAQVIAAELGISFDNEKLKINELLPGMRKINVIGKVINLFPVRVFTTKNGEESKVCNLLLADETSNIKVVLWDTSHIDLIENGQIKEGSVVEIANASMRETEIHLGSFSEFKPSQETISDVKTERVVQEKNISDFKNGMNVSVRAFIVQSFEPRFFYVCPECRKKAVSGLEGFICAEHGKVAAEKRALINFVIDDGTETIRSVAFSDILPKIGLTELENIEVLIQQRENLLGKEMVFSGNVRNNKFFNNNEFIVDDAREINVDELIENLSN